MTGAPIKTVANRVAGCSLLVAIAVLAGCAAPATPPAPPPSSHATVATVTARSARQAQPNGTAAATCDPEKSSLAPLGPPQVTPGSFVATIRKRGYLIAGVDQNTYDWGYLNPLDGAIEGFDIDMVNAVAKAIFGTAAGHVHLKAISDDQRKQDILNRSVDIVAHTMTILCSRLKYLDFSAVYFVAHQKILVPSNSTVTIPSDLAGQKVCVTKSSDSGAQLLAVLPPAQRPVIKSVDYITDCLVLLQQDQVAAITTDDVILYGLHKQDPFTTVLTTALTNEPYGLAISKQHPDFVRFVNAVLAQYIANGSWRRTYEKWVGSPAPAPPPQEYAK